jgi:hypothetical protein
LRPKLKPQKLAVFLHADGAIEMSDTIVFCATNRRLYTNSLGNKSLSLHFFKAVKLRCRLL